MHTAIITAIALLTSPAPDTLSAIPGGDVYRTLTLGQLQFEPGDAGFPAGRTMNSWGLQYWPQLHVTCEGAEEAYVGIPFLSTWNGTTTLGELELSVRAEPGAQVAGVLYVPLASGQGMTRHPFHVRMPTAQDQGGSGARADFLENRFLHYSWRYEQDLPGAAWYRHQAEATRRALQELGVQVTFDPDGRLNNSRRRRRELQDTYDLFTGGRALSENLALEEVLTPTGDEVGRIPIEELPGITTREMDWAEAIADLDPELDPLAERIPFDQHALFFPSFDAMVRVLDEARANGAPVLELFDSNSENAHTQERYERQLCLPLDAAARLMGSQLVQSVVITGSDPYLRTGTDVAVILRSSRPALLEAFLVERQRLSQKTDGAREVQGTAGGYAWRGVLTGDRRIGSYLMRLGDDLVVCNSVVQLERLAAVAAGEVPTLASLGEYVFFRDRYPLGTDDEDAFLVLSDATIRRWGSPHWRIGASRRTRAAAVLAEARASELTRSLSDVPLVGPALGMANLPVPGGGTLMHTDDGPRSERYGTERFLTPIIELDIDRVTPAERSAYEVFRRSYDRRWRQVFDPIAARVVVRADRLELDLSVVPLVLQTDYRELIELTRGATLAPTGGDPHEGTLIHFAMALGRESGILRKGGEFAKMFAPGIADPLAWLGDDVAIYVENDPALLKEFESAPDVEEFLEQNLHRLPLGIHLPSKSPLRMALFMTGVRGYIESSAPGLVHFETRTHAERGYVAVIPEDIGSMTGELALYYVSLPDGLVLSLREDLVQRAIDRFQSRQAGEVPTHTWLGESVALSIGPGFKPVLDAFLGREWGRERQRMAWKALPILNEWRAVAGARDPIAFHTQHWGVELRCPAGEGFVWNEEWQTYESSVFGHPGQPRMGDRLPALVRAARGAELGLTFAQDGLRARVRIDR